MKTFTASHLSHKPAEVFEEARTNGAVIQQKRTNGDVVEEFVLIPKESLDELLSGTAELSNLVAELGEQAGIKNDPLA